VSVTWILLNCAARAACRCRAPKARLAPQTANEEHILCRAGTGEESRVLCRRVTSPIADRDMS